MKCTSCGVNVREGAVYCNKCGSRLIAPQPSAAPAVTPAPRQSVAKAQKKPMGVLKFIIPAVAVLLVAVIVLLIVFNPFSGNEKNKPDNVTITSSMYSTTAITKNGMLRTTDEDFTELSSESGWYNLVSVATGEGVIIALKNDGTAIAFGRSVELNDEWENLVQVAAGEAHVVALKKDGTVLASGDNGRGQCDVEDWKDIVYVAAGYHQTIGVKKNGTVVVAGMDADGVMDVEEWEDIVSVSTNEWITLGLKSDGTVVATNYEEEGDFNVDGWKDIVSVSAGCIHAVGIKADGSAVFTGSNSDNRADVSKWKNLAAISAGGAHTVGLTYEGAVIATGYNRYGQCDVTDWTDIMLPDSAVSDEDDKDSDSKETETLPPEPSYEKRYNTIQAGSAYTVGVKNDGSLIVTGSYYYDTDLSRWDNVSELADSIYNVVALRKDGTVLSDMTYVDVSDLSGIVDVAAGSSFIAALRKNGTVDMRVSPRAGEDFEADTVESWTDIVDISASVTHTVGLKKDGTVVAAGRNVNGQCNVEGWTDIVAISAGSDYTIGLKSDGTVVATEYIDTEYSVYSGACDVDGWTDIVAISAGNAHTVGLKKDGTVVATGSDFFGRLRVEGWRDIVAISAGDIHTVGLKSDGTVVATEFINDGIHNPEYKGWSDVSGWRDIAVPSGVKFTASSEPENKVTTTEKVVYMPTEAELDDFMYVFIYLGGDDFKAGTTSGGEVVDGVMTNIGTIGVYAVYFDDYKTYESWRDDFVPDPLGKFEYGYKVYDADNMAWVCENIFHTEFDESYTSENMYCYDGKVYMDYADVKSGLGLEIVSCKPVDGDKYEIVVREYNRYDPEEKTLDTVTVITDIQEIDGEKQWTIYEISTR